MRTRDVRLIGSVLLALSLGLLAGGEPLLDAAARLSGTEGAVCPYRLATGRPCMGCGGTHAFARAARGEFGEALRLNWLGAGAGVLLWAVAGLALLAFSSGAGGFLRAAAIVSGVGGATVFIANAVRWWLISQGGVV